MQAPLPFGDGKRIFRQGEVIHAHIDVARIHEGIQGACEHAHFRRCTRQLRRDDAPLGLEALWQVGVCIQRYAIRPQLCHLGQRAIERLGRLARQTINQIDIDRLKTQSTCCSNQIKHLFSGLNTVHGLLHFRIEILYAKTQAIEAQLRQQPEALDRDGARVDLDRVLATWRQREAAAQHSHQFPQAFIGEKRGRAAAKVQLTHHLPMAAVGCVQIDLPSQIAKINLRTVMVLGDDFVARAVVAQRFAKRDVHIQRQGQCLGRRTQLALLQRQGVLVLAKGLNEPVCGGI